MGCDQANPYHHPNHIKIESPNIILVHTRTLEIVNRFKACLTHLRLLRQLKESILDAFKVVLRVRAAAGAGGNEFLQIIMPRCGSILQAGTCQIFSIAGNPRWSRVWQLVRQMMSIMIYTHTGMNCTSINKTPNKDIIIN